jgi:hypothetical protein
MKTLAVIVVVGIAIVGSIVTERQNHFQEYLDAPSPVHANLWSRASGLSLEQFLRAYSEEDVSQALEGR